MFLKVPLFGPSPITGVNGAEGGGRGGEEECSVAFIHPSISQRSNKDTALSETFLFCPS